jgi:Ca2+-binding EF-hand superfamily protein
MKINRKPIFTLLALAIAFSTAPTFAQDVTDDATSRHDTNPANAVDIDMNPIVVTPQDDKPQNDTDVSTKEGWAKVDTNHDGVISKDEAMANRNLTEIFDKADTNHDGKLTAREYRIYMARHPGKPSQAKKAT